MSRLHKQTLILCEFMPLVSSTYLYVIVPMFTKMHMEANYSLNNTELFLRKDLVSIYGLLASKIAYYNFEWRFITLVMFSTLQATGLQTFLKNYNQSVIVKLGRFVPQHRIPVPQFVIFGEEASQISSTIRWLVREKYDSNSKFIIICVSNDEDCDENKIFQTLLKVYILNVIVLKASSFSYLPQAYSYNILVPEKCLNAEPIEVDLIMGCLNDTCFKELFPERLFNFHKCRLFMSTVEQPPFMFLHNGTRQPSGTDGDIMRLAADMLNATLILSTPTDGNGLGHYVNKNWTGSLGDIYNSRVHASVCSAPLTTNKYGNFQISFTYYSMDMVWAAKLPPEYPPWEKLLYPLKIHVRGILLFMFIVVIVMNSLRGTNFWRNIKRTLHMSPSKHNLLFYSWLLFLGLPILKTPKRTSIRVMLYTWIWCCFVLRCAYQATLITSLKHPAYSEKLETFRDALQDGNPYGGPPSIRDYYYGDHDIYDNWVEINYDHLYKRLDEISNGSTDFVIASNREIIKHYLMTFNGTKQLQIIPEKIVNSPTVVYFRKYSPLTSPLSYVLRVSLEGGFVQRIYSRYLKDEKDLLRRDKNRGPEPLTLHHFAGCFVILVIGWFLSTIYFAVEYICGNLDEEITESMCVTHNQQDESQTLQN